MCQLQKLVIRSILCIHKLRCLLLKCGILVPFWNAHLFSKIDFVSSSDNANVWTPFEHFLKYVPNGQYLVMAWRGMVEKPLHQRMLIPICNTLWRRYQRSSQKPASVNTIGAGKARAYYLVSTSTNQYIKPQNNGLRFKTISSKVCSGKHYHFDTIIMDACFYGLNW